MKRHYQSVSVGRADAGYTILLDGRPVKTPARVTLAVPNAPLAEAVAAEWSAQGETIKPAEMHLTAFATTALDKGSDRKQSVVQTLAGYAATDLLCYRAESPAELARRQEERWQPILDWLALTFDAPLTVTKGILPVPQPEASLRAIRAALERLDGLHLVPTATIVDQLGSTALGLAVAHRRISAEEAIALSHIDDDYQADLWGWDAEAATRRRAVAAEVAAAETFLRLLDA
ncbi:ATP12 family protein [Fodinicurvata sp. EGI_FJ10296]|uniref:ATP12 family chaperone protein n=1 Tax=Fodinicurvata sp. EGI_FJ10296 TaxID=3231908 RepID=UPI0034512964